MRKFHYHLVDVFTGRAFGGNPLAVFPDGRDVPADLMQRIANELNLSETTFVLPPEDAANDRRVRIFTPASELPFAGHPTVGTAFVLAREGLVECAGDGCTIRLEEGVGVIPVAVEMEDGAPGMIVMDQPLPQFGAVIEDRAAVAAMLCIDPAGIDARYPVEVVSCGVPFLFVPLTDLATIRRARPRPDLMEQTLKGVGASYPYVFTQETELAGSTVHGRMFAPELGIVEDPATGAANGPLGCYLVKHEIAPRAARVAIVSEQGFEIGRPSLLYLTIEQTGGAITRVRVGGRCVYIGAGYIQWRA